MNSSYYVPAALAILAVLFIYLFMRSKKDTGAGQVIPYLPPGPAPQSDEKPSASSLAIFGDSITVPMDLSAAANEVVNRAIAGTTGSAWLLGPVVGPQFTIAKMEEELSKTTQRAALWRYGINDANFNLGLPLYQQAVETFVDVCRQNGIVPILSSLTQFSGTQAQAVNRLAYNATIYAVAVAKHVHFIDVASVPFLPGDTPDNLHPGLGYRERIVAYILSQFRVLRIFS